MYQMNKYFSLLIVAMVILSSCGNPNRRGEIVGVKGRSWQPYQPYGMVLVPGGAFTMGKQNEDKSYSIDAPVKTVTVHSFYMDETEITNSEYREFVNYVRDSVIRTRLAKMVEDEGLEEDRKGIGRYAYKSLDTAKNAYNRYMIDKYGGLTYEDEETMGKRLNWKVPIIFNRNKFPDEYYAEVFDSLYLPLKETPDGERLFDVKQFKYRYSWVDMDAAIRAGKQKSEFRHDTIIEVYPDTTVWVKDFMYAYNEPMVEEYFWHDAYNDYPVVGVNWYQANAFADYRTKKMNWYLRSHHKPTLHRFRLPTEAEWEYAARGGRIGTDYPWGSPYTMNEKACFLANFKPLRGDYGSDQSVFTARAKSYNPNGYGLYNMAGNVSEWTNTSYNPDSYLYVTTFNPTTHDWYNKRKVIRGGSWKDVKYYIQVSTRTYEYADSARSYVGFRCVQDFMGSNAKRYAKKARSSQATYY
ncbi:MAG: gliding motility lipoprotein GldK [Chlorobi bacterium]|nr:gliding motility lipoprotein GldK [Chlorobiota bacterium]